MDVLDIIYFYTAPVDYFCVCDFFSMVCIHVVYLCSPGLTKYCFSPEEPKQTCAVHEIFAATLFLTH